MSLQNHCREEIDTERTHPELNVKNPLEVEARRRCSEVERRIRLMNSHKHSKHVPVRKGAKDGNAKANTWHEYDAE